MGIKWIDVTEIVIGFSLKGKLDPNAINPNDCYPPYGEIVPLLRDELSIPDIVTKVGYAGVRAAIEASENVNGDMKPMEWLGLLTKRASDSMNGEKLLKVAQDMVEGKEVDLGIALKALTMADNGYRELTPMSEIEAETNNWILTGWQPLDRHLGGLPKASLTIIGASPGVGKTTLSLKLATSMARRYKKKKVAFFTLEMTMAQLTARALELDKSITKEEKSRILLTEFTYNVSELYAISSRVAASEDLSLIVVDFADQLVEGEQSESVMGMIYRSTAMLAKKTGVPVVLISQLNRSTYTGGIPRINHLRYSGMAEAMSALILLIYNPTNILVETSQTAELQITPGRGYLLAGKSRYGFLEGGPGAMQVEWDGKGGWGNKSFGWFNLVT